MFERILIANRGEIACRVIETANKLGIETIAIFSEADSEARHVKLANQAYLVGPAIARDSYLALSVVHFCQNGVLERHISDLILPKLAKGVF